MQRILALKESNQLNKYHQQKYMSDNVNAIEECISSLVPRLLTLAKDGLTMDVRRLALRCLSELRKAQTVVLLSKYCYKKKRCALSFTNGSRRTPCSTMKFFKMLTV
ncbi:hypothetical protein OUZ56_021614 [Daphnia magna]|uniref:Uncharacterized protein n=1 Tax=Daphnia magna TaxID=35525 RepID=A0ABR0AU04_9CRUS|nr:hypothetical protein OUZ56_021614 [Daphnia magna]